MNDLEALSCATAEFGRRLDRLDSDQWDVATSCGDWSVRDLVRHLNLGNKMAELLLHGADGKASVGPAAQPPDDADPGLVYKATSQAQQDAFAEEGALARTVHHPAMDMTGDMLLMFRTMDLTLHAWDLGSSVGGDTDLDEALCASIWTRLEPIAPLLAGSGMFGTPKGDVMPDASAREKLLHATGR
jgi:uncharacterized protein (TIGR03086 family)